jgi:CheY-like chemotaxis protein
MVREWGGDIAVESGPAGGNAFSIYLPYVDAPSVGLGAPPALPAIQVPPPLPDPLRETILVVDDEPGIRGLMRKILRRERYMVLEAGNAEEALAVALSHAGPIDLLLTDVMMPGLTGPELARRMCAAAPNLKVLYISGYAAEETLQAGQMPPGFAFLPKPFTLGALVSKVRETLDT